MIGLEPFIVDNPINKTNLDALLKSFRKESFVPFVGAGPSTILGAADWKTLIVNLCNSFGITGFKKIKDSGGNIDYPRTFSSLFKKLGMKGITADQFYNKLFECIKPTKTEATWTHLYLVKLFDACITTNYDSPIEKAFEEHHKRSATRYFFSCYGLSNFKDCIVYLHGHKEINFCIIKAEEYDYFYPSISKKNGIPIIEEFLAEIFTKKNVIFVGFSFDDQFFEKYLEHLHSITPLKKYHYWLLSESSKYFSETLMRAEEYKNAGAFDRATSEVAKFYEGTMNIKPIVYKKGEHIFIEKLFNNLLESLPAAMVPGELNGIPLR